MKNKKTKKWIVKGSLSLIFIVLFITLYVLSSLSGLRFFIPHYFDIAGGPFSEKNYLVILQNNNNLTPNGGEIMTYGTISFKNGLFNDIKINASDKAESINQESRNTSADLLNIYKLTNPDIKFDGVVAINLEVLSNILNIIGSVNIDGITINSANIAEIMGNSDNQTLRDISKKIIYKSFLSILAWRNLSDMFVKNFNEKHIRLYSFNESFEKQLKEKGWSDTWIANSNNNFFATTEANLSQNQLDKYINRSVNYRLYLCNSEINKSCAYTAKIFYTIEHTDQSPEAKNYEGYIRFYFPKNTELKSSNAYTTYEENKNYNIIGTTINLKPGEHKTIEMAVTLPKTVFNQKSYSLYIPKQPGTIGDFYSIIIETPNGTNLTSKLFDTYSNIASWQGKLLKNKNFSLSVTQPS